MDRFFRIEQTGRAVVAYAGWTTFANAPISRLHQSIAKTDKRARRCRQNRPERLSRDSSTLPRLAKLGRTTGFSRSVPLYVHIFRSLEPHLIRRFAFEASFLGERWFFPLSENPTSLRESEVCNMGRAVDESDRQRATGAGPGLIRLPYIYVLISRSVVSQTAVARRYDLLNIIHRSGTAVHRLR